VGCSHAAGQTIVFIRMYLIISLFSIHSFIIINQEWRRIWEEGHVKGGFTEGKAVFILTVHASSLRNHTEVSYIKSSK